MRPCSPSLTPCMMNWRARVVLPVPADPSTRVAEPSRSPPLRMWSRPSHPVLTLLVVTLTLTCLCSHSIWLYVVPSDASPWRCRPEFPSENNIKPFPRTLNHPCEGHFD